MAENSNPKAPVILGSHLRPTAENMLALYFHVKQQRQQSLTQSWGQVFPGDGDQGTDTINDNSVAPPTNYNANAILSVMDGFIDFMEDGAPSRLDLLMASRRIG